MATNKQIYQFPNKSSPQGNDLLLLSDESTPAHLTKNCTFNQAKESLAPPGGIFTPTVNASVNLSAVTPLYGRYSGNKSSTGGIITAVSKFLVTATDANAVCKLTLTTPLPSAFAAQRAAQILGLPSFVVNSGDETIGNTGAGWNKDLFANIGGSTIDFWFEVAQSAVEYILDVGYSYEIQ